MVSEQASSATEPEPPTAGDTYSVSLASGGKVSVVVSVNLFTLSSTDRTFVLGLVDSLTGYYQAQPDDKPEEGAS